MPRRLAEAFGAYPKRAAAIVGGLLVLAVVWHLCLPGFFYRSPGVFIDGPLPAVAGVAVALWLWRAEPPILQAIIACACALLAVLASVAVLGTLAAGPLRSIPALWGELREGFRLPFSVAVDTWGSPYFRYALWSGLRPLLLWATLAFVAILLRRPAGPSRLGGLTGRLADRWAFATAQRRQMNSYRSVYLAALRGGETPPPPPSGLMPGAGGPHGLATAHLVLKIGLAVAGALGLIGGAWSLLGDALRGPLGSIFVRGLTAGG